MCAAFKDYREVLEMDTLNFLEYDVMWVVFKLSSASGALGSEAIEIINWLICFICALEE